MDFFFVKLNEDDLKLQKKTRKTLLMSTKYDMIYVRMELCNFDYAG